MIRRHRLAHETRVAVLAAALGLPGVVATGVWLAQGVHGPAAWALGVGVAALWIGLAMNARARTARPLQTISNLVAALRAGDYSVRGHVENSADALGGALGELNAFAASLRDERLGEMEATALLEKVIGEIDVAIFAFDGAGRLKLVNHAGERLIGRTATQLAGTSAAALEMSPLLEGETPRLVETTFTQGGVWELRRSSFRQQGLPHQLVVLSNLQRAMREEERQAWQRLVRVLGHEINNSLTPIRSLAANMRSNLRRSPQPEGWRDDLDRGLEVIEKRSEALGRFMAAYARLAKLPPPNFAAIEIAPWVRRIAELEKRVPVHVEAGPAVSVMGDGDQLDQLLINLVQNAADAALETGGTVTVTWSTQGNHLELTVLDEGAGLPPAANLFVPFFTTKPNGSGIGLVLARQVAEAHRGSLTLRNRDRRTGVEARVRLLRA